MVGRSAYLLAPLPALVVGGWTIADLGGSVSRLALNVGAAVAGSMLVVAAGHRPRAGGGSTGPSTIVSVVVGFGAVALIALSLLFAGRDGVHRWAGVGSLQLQLSLLLSPLVVLAVGRLALLGRASTAVLLVLAVQTVHLVQPDGAQAAAVAAASIALASSRRLLGSTVTRVVLAFGSVGLAVATWARPDPLPAVADVEGILRSAASISPALGLAAGAAVAALIVPFVLDWGTRPATDPGRVVVLALGAAVAGTLVAAQVGTFPVLVAGYGVSTVLAYYTAASCAVVAGRWHVSFGDA